MAEHPFGHESPEVHTGRLLAVLGALALFVVVALVLLYVARHAVMPHHTQVAARPGVIPTGPRLEPHPDSNIARERAQKHLMLSHYAWIGPSHRFARIPIQRAMHLYVQQHGARHKAKAEPTTDAPKTETGG